MAEAQAAKAKAGAAFYITHIACDYDYPARTPYQVLTTAQTTKLPTEEKLAKLAESHTQTALSEKPNSVKQDRDASRRVIFLIPKVRRRDQACGGRGCFADGEVEVARQAKFAELDAAESGGGRSTGNGDCRAQGRTRAAGCFEEGGT
ncbi:hypothetical protein H2201_001803 [Coniosporium apollinis]|uniref:Uncharacterized protein n=2 Tax=Coniosporium TaxID=2810619 RepID=A0ABQ9P1T7_9PEZI|nr:hypothetical protein H2199_000438 [Cladosporium sp. JES 115]KAJ9667998.1 hypothetical protein H2201_001803 [Coniosporium apollinis]